MFKVNYSYNFGIQLPQFFLPYSLCPMPYALCPMPNALCPMPNALCPMPNALCPTSYCYGPQSLKLFYNLFTILSTVQ